MPEELFDVVDEDDRVIGRAPRSEVHARGLRHRAVHVFVFDSRGRLLLQWRSAEKDEFPCCYTSSASGHLDAGEGYDASARRELREELGLTAPLERLAKFAAGPETANEHTVLYRARTDERPTPDPAEIESTVYFNLAEIARRIARCPEQFASPFRVLFEWYRRSQGGE